MDHRPYRGLLTRGSLAVPAIVCGGSALAAAQDGAHSGELTPFLLSLAAILVAAKIGGELVERCWASCSSASSSATSA